MANKTLDEIKAEELSKRLNKVLGNSPTKKSAFKTFKKPAKDLGFVNKFTGIDIVKMKSGKDGIDGKDGSPDSPQDIANKLNMLEEAVEAKVIKGMPKVKDLIDELKKGKYLETRDIKGLPINMNDMRWHGSSAGITQITHDSTLTGLGTPVSPLGVVTPGHTIEDEGVALAQRSALNFVGAGVTVTDSGTKTVVTVSSTGLNEEDPVSGIVDSSNLIFTFNNQPKVVSIDGLVRRVNHGYSLSGSGPYTVTVDALITPTYDVFSLY